VLQQVSTPAAQESLTIDPPPQRWKSLLGGETSAEQAQFRSELGLPGGRIIMSGHQAEFWHPGILAKSIAAQSAALALGGQAVWLVADQDSNDPCIIQYPTRVLTRASWRIALRNGAGPKEFLPDTPTAMLPPLAPQPPPSDGPPFVASGLRAIARALAACGDQPNAARQVAAAAADLASTWVQRPTLLFATQLSQTTLFQEFVGHMCESPHACASAYNDAARRVPRARIRDLAVDAERVELPLWRVRPGRPRAAVFAPEVAGVPPHELAPRALLMTALLRLAGCDLFIHGTGGGVYDRITDAWIAGWLPGRRLSPTTVVSATRLLPLSDQPQPEPQAIARATWGAHHARHNPRMLGDETAEEERQALLRQVRTARADGRDPRGAFQRMHEFLETYRAAHASELAGLTTASAAARSERAKAEVVYSRGWAFPLYPSPVLEGLRSAIAAEFD
jgi:hypothetical protein